MNERDGNADNEVMQQLRVELGDEYTDALSEQLTNSTEHEEHGIPFGRCVFPSPTETKQVNMVVHTETRQVDMNGDPAMYAYMVIDTLWVFQVMDSERFIKRYAFPDTDGSLAAALDALGIGGP